MSKLKVEGGKPLNGEIIPQGAKNEALQVIGATVLHAGKTIIHNMPRLTDVLNLLQILEDAGAEVNWINKPKDKTNIFCKSVEIDTSKLKGEYFVTENFLNSASKLRGSITLLGPVLARFGSCFVPRPGGDKIGARPITTHLLGLRDMGVSYKIDKKQNTVLASIKKVKSSKMILEEASVTGTANILMAAARIENDELISIYNAACEPYIQQLISYMSKLGFNITGSGTNLITITKNEETTAAIGIIEHELLPDFIEVASFMGLAVLTNSQLKIKNVRVDMLGLTLSAFNKLGAHFKVEGDDIIMGDNSVYVIREADNAQMQFIYDQPWPMLSPDILSILLTCAIQAKGTVLINQRMFESRLFFVDRLQKMGAEIVLCDPHRAIVVGLNRQKKLKGAEIESPDIRAGISLLMAALSAEGQSIISNIEQIDRGYEDIDGRLKKLGAKLTRV